MRFGTPIWNIGEGILQIRQVEKFDENGNLAGRDAYQDIFDADGKVVESRLVGEMLWHKEHDHFHMQDQVRYDLVKGDPRTGEVVASSGKISICYMDFKHIPGWPKTGGPSYTFEECYGKVYGITPDWQDEHPNVLPQQWIDVTHVPNGEYYLVNTVDVEHTLHEMDDGDESNNSNWMKVKLSNNARNVRVIHK